MKRLSLNFSQKKRASTLLALAQSEFEAAGHLCEKQLFKESLVHLYFTCFYASQALLIEHIRPKPSHQHLESTLHKVYGRSKVFPRRYIRLHTLLHKMRVEYDYQNSNSPDPDEIKKQLRLLAGYVNFAFRVVPKLEILSILKGIYEDNKKIIKDFSYDIYCPKTYSHHTRVTFWQPPFYLPIFSQEKIGVVVKESLRRLRVNKWRDYVVGLNSRLNQYSDDHLIMLDVDTVNPAVEAALKPIGGILLKSGRGFHFIGRTVILGQGEWNRLYRRLSKDKRLSKHLDQDHIKISLKRGYATLRITASRVKPRVPFFYKEI